MVQRGLEFDLYQNSARKYLGFCIKMVRKGNKYLDLVFKWCEKCQRRRELLTVGGSIVMFGGLLIKFSGENQILFEPLKPYLGLETQLGGVILLRVQSGQTSFRTFLVFLQLSA